MKIDPDGFPRITSSGESVRHYARVIEVSDDEGGVYYKPVWIADENESESEKSEEEPWSDDDIPNIELSVENVPDIQLTVIDEKTKDVEPQVAEQKPQQPRKNHSENNKYRSPRKIHSKNNIYRTPQPRKEHGKNNGASRNQHMYNSSKRNFLKKSGNSNKDKYKYIPNQSFCASSSFPRNYTKPRGDIEPWLQPPVIINTPGTFSYPFPCASSFQSHNVESGRTPIPRPSSIQNHNVEGGRKSIGLLGDTPYSNPRNFIPNIQNESFIHNQNWNENEYCGYSQNNYHRKPRLAPGPLQGGSGQGAYQRKPKNRNKAWKRKNTSGHFEYRN